VTSIVITHHIDSAFAVSDRIALVRDRRIDLVVDAKEAERRPPEPLAEFLQGNALEEGA
jgi:ABC-type transporter Mla maintaining outer membrane lipid asymmetry ATPase subunit MlaF